jgi:hypothetical protein
MNHPLLSCSLVFSEGKKESQSPNRENFHEVGAAVGFAQVAGLDGDDDSVLLVTIYVDNVPLGGLLSQM